MNAICLKCESRTCEHVAARPPRLRAREAQIVKLLAGGLSNKEIATAAGITVGTVKVYLNHAFRSLGLTSRLEVALWARDHRELLELGKVAA